MPKSRAPQKSRRKPSKTSHPRPNRLISVTPRDKAAGRWFAKLVALQARLYGPGGCPWDREQTHESLRKYLIEETYEVLDAMDSGEARKFCGELGDLLLQVVFHSILAEETGEFRMSDVIESIYTKMVRRHPHVFGKVEAKDSAAVLKNWEQIKAEERADEARTQGGQPAKGKARSGTAGTQFVSPESVLAGVPRSLPAVLEAYQLTRRASHVGFDWENLSSIFEKLDEERRELEAELALSNGRPESTGSALKNSKRAKVVHEDTKNASKRLEEEVGDFLFSAVNVARFLKVDPEIALKNANDKFKRRFSWMEAAALREGRSFADVERNRKEELWNESKRLFEVYPQLK